jgi:4-hydroxymandelate oxidase
MKLKLQLNHINVYDFEESARRKLSRMVFDYYASGAHDEITLRQNHAAYERIRIKHRVLADVSSRDLSVNVLGQPAVMPILVAPTAFHRMAHPDGEVATARAAGASGTIMVLSTLSNSSVEEVMDEATGTVWFQLYVYKDRGVTRALVQRAEQAGCKALVLTVDAPILGRRERDTRNRFQLPGSLLIENLVMAGKSELPKKVAKSGLEAYFSAVLDPSLTWRDVEWLRSITSLPVLVKGVVRADDAVRAMEHGVSGVIVSNHGGRQLDTSPATIEVLPEIADAVSARVELFIDGGVRRGTDVLKALAMGAQAVLVGRPILWGLAVGGEQGVIRVLDILRRELDLAMALCGCPTIDHIGRDLIA